MAHLKNYIIIGLAVALVASLAGNKAISKAFNDWTRHGTLAGVDECVRLNSSDVLSKEATKKACASKFEVFLPTAGLNGVGGPQKNRLDVTLAASLRNDLTSVVYTWAQVKLFVRDEEGVEQAYSSSSSLWGEPESTYEYSAILQDLKPENYLAEKHCNDVSEKANCWTWGVVSARGVRIK